MIRKTVVLLALVALASFSFFGLEIATSNSLTARAAENAQLSPAAVEGDPHEFMEYVFEPTFKRLKLAMASQPVDSSGWKTIKSDALILAEGGNLLLLRKPELDAAKWVDHSIELRDVGGQLYRAAKKKDFPASRKAYELMVTRCNTCHQQFAEGEHQLEP